MPAVAAPHSRRGWIAAFQRTAGRPEGSIGNRRGTGGSGQTFGTGRSPRVHAPVAHPLPPFVTVAPNGQGGQKTVEAGRPCGGRLRMHSCQHCPRRGAHGATPVERSGHGQSNSEVRRSLRPRRSARPASRCTSSLGRQQVSSFKIPLERRPSRPSPSAKSEFPSFSPTAPCTFRETPRASSTTSDCPKRSPPLWPIDGSLPRRRIRRIRPLLPGLTLSSALKEVSPTGSIVKGKPRTVNGQPTTSLSGTGPTGIARVTLFVAAHGNALPVEAVGSGGSAENASGEIVTFSRWGEAVHVPVPTESIPISTLSAGSPTTG